MPSPYKKRSRKKMPGVPLQGAIQRRLAGGGTRSIPEISGPKMTMPSGRSIKKPSAPSGPATAVPRVPRKSAPTLGGTRTMDGATPLMRAVSRRMRATSAARKGVVSGRPRPMPGRKSS